MTAAGEQAAVPVSKQVKAALMVLSMLCTLIVVLDSTIAVVALPHMQAALGATPDTISWVLTSYITATAVATPLTGWLGGRIGRRELFIASTIGFTLSSALCGIATSLPLMVAARLAQGFSGAFIVPLSQAIMYDINAPKDQVRAITLWGIGSMIGPVLGPVVGGYLTDMFNWRWVFFINVPLGIAAIIGMIAMMPKFPDQARPFDKIGFLLLGTALAALQLVLDRGTSQDWFESPEIIIEGCVFIVALWILIFHLRRTSHPIVPGKLFLNRNFNIAITFVFFLGGMTAAGSALIAPMVETLFHYPVMDAGLMLMPRGAAMMVAMLTAGWLLHRFDLRFVVGAGMIVLSYGLWLTCGFTLVMGSSLILISGMVIGFGTGLAIMPVNYLAGSSQPIELRTDAAAIYSLTRNLGASLFVAVTSALLTRNLQINHAELSGKVTSATLPLARPGIMEQFGLESGKVVAMIDAEINRQSMMIAYLDNYWLIAIAIMTLLPLVILVKPPLPGKKREIVIGGE